MAVRGGIPRTLALIQELGGKMFMASKEYESASTTFFQAFKTYDKAGDPSRLKCLKYLVMASMLHTITIDPAEGFQPHHGRAVAFGLKLKGDLNKQAQKLSKQLYDAFLATDCEMLEINPLVESEDGKLLVLDAKMSFDSNALYRHKDIEGLRFNRAVALGLQKLLGDPSLLLGAVRSPEQEILAPKLDAMISAIVGYVDHVVDTVAERIIGTGSQISEAVRRRRVEARSQDQFVEWIEGLFPSHRFSVLICHY